MNLEKMKTINMKSLVKILRGLLDGSLKLVATSTGKKAAPAPKKQAGRKPVRKLGRKPGRKPLPSTIKKQKEIAAKRAKIKAAKSQLPTPREIFIYMQDKLEGVKITGLAAHFKVKRMLLKPMIAKLVKSEDLTQVGGTLFLQRRIRRVGGKKTEKPAPISDKEVLAYLEKNPDSTMAVMGKELGGGKYQKLIKVLNKLVKDGKVQKNGKIYRVS